MVLWMVLGVVQHCCCAFYMVLVHGRGETLLVHNHRLVWELIRFTAMKKPPCFLIQTKEKIKEQKPKG